MAHRQRFVEVDNNNEYIDVQIAELIENIWKLNIHTLSSCQNNPGTGFAYIDFLSSNDATDFLNIVAVEFSSNNPNSYYNKIAQTWAGDKEYTDEWIYEPELINCGARSIEDEDGVIIGEELIDNSNNFHFAMRVSFPKKHLKKVEKAIADAVIHKNLEANISQMIENHIEENKKAKEING